MTDQNLPGATPPEDKGSKSFSQEQLDQIVRDRLERQRVQLNKEMDALRSGVGDAEETRKLLDAYRKQVAGMLDERKKGMSAPVLQLLEKLDPLEQLNWLAANPTETTKPIPATPKPEHKAPGLDEAIAAKRAQGNYSI